MYNNLQIKEKNVTPNIAIGHTTKLVVQEATKQTEGKFNSHT